MQQELFNTDERHAKGGQVQAFVVPPFDVTTRLPIIVAFGGGVNSTALLIELYRRQIQPDLILFADTGGERPETYAHVHNFSFWLKHRGMPRIKIVRRHDTLESNCLKRKALPAVAYGFRTCSIRYKMLPQDQFVSKWKLAWDAWKHGKKVIKLVGYDTFEYHRAKYQDDDKFSVRYPLLDWDYSRDDCERICLEAGLRPKKSSCFFCPHMKKPEILEMACRHPDLMERALKIEDNAELETVAGLGRRFAWREFLSADEQRREFFNEDDQDMPCGCYDG